MEDGDEFIAPDARAGIVELGDYVLVVVTLAVRILPNGDARNVAELGPVAKVVAVVDGNELKLYAKER